LEFPIQTPAGERFLECRFIPEFAPDGSVESLMTLTRDVTERKRAEAELRRANADLEQFAYSASHDLQEPIRSVSVYSELLARRYSNLFDEQARQYLRFITGAAQRMEMLVKDLLAYTKSANMEEEPSGEVDAANALSKALRTSPRP
jgi:light-regulated signal transduction histidine kinase (bacteriophytochrome)